MAGPKTPEDLLDSAETLSVETQAVSPSSAASLYTEGQLIGDKYRLLRRLGEGGMASVWVAHNEALDIHVAIKFIRAELQHAGLANRLLQEARAAAQLKHPAIVRVTDYGKTPTGDPYIVMELLNGEDLGAVIKRKGPMLPMRAVRTLLPIADALAVAHSKKIVHRDLKPENVFLAQEENGKTQPKLVDFGIAKLEREDTQRITQMGAAMGSPAYMSPEQARGLDVDARTDVWALCVVLYEVLTGHLPFNGNSYTSLVVAILESKPKPLMEHGIADSELWAIIAKGLEKEPDTRWPSMRELGGALARWALAHSVADDITGSNLQTSWIERPPDSMPLGSESSTSNPVAAGSSPLAAPIPLAGSGSGQAATQLSATLSGPATVKSRPTWVIVGVAAVIVLGIGVGVALRALGGTAAKPEPATPDRPTVQLTASAEPPKPLEPSVEPTVASTAEPPASAEPLGKKPVTKPPVSKPAGKPAAAVSKPTEKPTKPSEKDPMDQLKTF